MQIEDYSFGQVIIDGEKYTSDLLICNKKIKTDWWRIKGHELHLEDLTWVLEQNPELLIIGTGKSGVMTVSQNLEERLRQDVELVIQPTTQAVKTYNQQLKRNLKIAAGFHLTC